MAASSVDLPAASSASCAENRSARPSVLSGAVPQLDAFLAAPSRDEVHRMLPAV